MKKVEMISFFGIRLIFWGIACVVFGVLMGIFLLKYQKELPAIPTITSVAIEADEFLGGKATTSGGQKMENRTKGVAVIRVSLNPSTK